MTVATVVDIDRPDLTPLKQIIFLMQITMDETEGIGILAHLLLYLSKLSNKCCYKYSILRGTNFRNKTNRRGFVRGMIHLSTGNRLTGAPSR